MKTKLKQSNFSPLSIQITVENVKDARLLYHILNNNDLRSTIIQDEDYWAENTESAKMSKHIKCSELLRLQIQKAIEATGNVL